MANSVFAKRLKEARTRAKLSQQKLGVAVGFDPGGAGPRINQYERGKHEPDFATAERLARALKVATPFLFARDDTLAAWILAFERVAPARRAAIVRKSALTG